MYTRKEYMAYKCTHKEYYSEIAEEAGINYDKNSDLPRIIRALEAGDEHLNTIPIAEWDGDARYTRSQCTPALRKRGDNVTLAGLVCIHKAAATTAAHKVIKQKWEEGIENIKSGDTDK